MWVTDNSSQINYKCSIIEKSFAFDENGTEKEQI
jgi:hypothetical protein